MAFWGVGSEKNWFVGSEESRAGGSETSRSRQVERSSMALEHIEFELGMKACAVPANSIRSGIIAQDRLCAHGMYT